MKPHTLVALGVLLGVTGAAATKLLTQQNAPPTAPYVARCIPTYDMETQLNQLGSRGWRLVSMAPSECLVPRPSGTNRPAPGFFVVLGR